MSEEADRVRAECPCLDALNGAQRGATYRLDVQTVRIGRNRDYEVVIDQGDDKASRRHARIVREANQYVIEDLGSRNGTYVNRKRIAEPVRLRDSDRIMIGAALFEYRVNPSSTVVSIIDAKPPSDQMAKAQPEAKLRAILDIAEAIRQTLDLDQLFPKILRGLFTIYPHADRALLVLCDPSGALVTGAVERRRGAEGDRSFSETIVREAIDKQMAILSEDAVADERFLDADSVAGASIRSVLCAPLIPHRDQNPLGVLQLDTRNADRPFETVDLQVLTGVAAQAAIAIENAYMASKMVALAGIERELHLAEQVQRSFLPRDLPKAPGYRFWAFYEAAGQVGGDYYDVRELPDERFAVVLGDVCGHGFAAALIMANATSRTEGALLTHPNDCASALGRINRSICAAGMDDRFITCVLCVIDTRSHRLSIANAGHPSPMIRRADGTIEEPAGHAVSGMPIGLFDDSEYQAVETDLHVGDSVVLFSDGVSDVMNPQAGQYSIERIRRTLGSIDLPPEELGESLLKDVMDHAGETVQCDDITLVTFGRVGVGAGNATVTDLGAGTEAE